MTKSKDAYYIQYVEDKPPKKIDGAFKILVQERVLTVYAKYQGELTIHHIPLSLIQHHGWKVPS